MITQTGPTYYRLLLCNEKELNTVIINSMNESSGNCAGLKNKKTVLKDDTPPDSMNEIFCIVKL